MRILFLDDCAYRHDFLCFCEHHREFTSSRIGIIPTPHTCNKEKYVIDHTYTARQAEQYLDLHAYDIIYLDHDLYSSSPDQTGMDVAAHLIRGSPKNPPKFTTCTIVIHSWNPEKAQEMYSLLSAVGFHAILAPFPV